MTNAIVYILLIHMLVRTSRLINSRKENKQIRKEQAVSSHLCGERKSAAHGETEGSTQSRDAKAAGSAVEITGSV